MSVERIVCPDDISAANACGEEMLRLIEAARNTAGRAAIAISGGSSPKPMFAHMAKAGFDWTAVHVFFVDERCVPPTDSASNYRMANEYFLRPTGIPDAQVHRIVGELNPQIAASEYAAEIEAFFAGQPRQFDVIHRGIGPDAHTASLFPDDPLINDRTGIAAATFAAKFNQWRVTLLPAVLLAARHTLVLATGADKAEPLSHVFGPVHDESKYPSQIGVLEDIPMTWYEVG